jgi:hypothetical protein
MGFLLIGVLSGGLNGYASGMFYVVVYVLMSLGAFGMILLLSREGFECENLDDFKGLNQRSPWYAFLMLLLMFSMAGVPPTLGFYAKFIVLQAIVEAGHIWLAVIAVMFSLIGAFYYLRIVKLMYFDDAVDNTPIRPRMDAQVLPNASTARPRGARVRDIPTAADGALREFHTGVAVVRGGAKAAGYERAAARVAHGVSGQTAACEIRYRAPDERAPGNTRIYCASRCFNDYCHAGRTHAAAGAAIPLSARSPLH